MQVGSIKAALRAAGDILAGDEDFSNFDAHVRFSMDRESATDPFEVVRELAGTLLTFGEIVRGSKR